MKSILLKRARAEPNLIAEIAYADYGGRARQTYDILFRLNIIYNLFSFIVLL